MSQEVDVSRRFAATAADVFARIADHPRFFPAPRYRCRLLEDGQPQRNGNGALREVRIGAMRFRERISQFSPDTGFDYRIEQVHFAGLPVPLRHERGWIEISDDGEGCMVRWRPRFSVGVPLIGGAIETRLARDVEKAFAWLLAQTSRSIADGQPTGS